MLNIPLRPFNDHKHLCVLSGFAFLCVVWDIQNEFSLDLVCKVKVHSTCVQRQGREA